MNVGSCFDKTLNKYGISATWLGRESGVNPQMISRFRNGREVQTDTLGKLLEPLPLEVKQYFFSLLLGGSLAKIDAAELVESLDSEELSELLKAAGERVKNLVTDVYSFA